MDLESLHRRHVEQLSGKTAAALEKTGYAALLLHSGTPLKRTGADDQYWSLRVTPHFHHWLPLQESGSSLLIVPGRRPRLFRPDEQSIWEAPVPPESDHFWGAFEVSRGAPVLPQGRIAFVGDDLRAAEALGIEALAVNPPALLRELDQLRVRKTPYEIECLAESNRREAAGAPSVRQPLPSGRPAGPAP